MNCIGVGFSETLSNARVMRAFVNGKDVVVWRSTSGSYRLGKIGVLTAACVCLMDLCVESWLYVQDGITVLVNVNTFLPIPTSNPCEPFKSKDIHHLKNGDNLSF